MPDQEGWRWAWCELNIWSSGAGLPPCLITDRTQRCGINLSFLQRHWMCQWSYMSTHMTFQMSAMIFVLVKMSGISVWSGLSYLIMFPLLFCCHPWKYYSSSRLHNLFSLQCTLKLSIQIVLAFGSFSESVWWGLSQLVFIKCKNSSN